MSSGLLVSDDLVRRILAQRLHEQDARHGFVLDGYPRTPDQIDDLDHLLAALGQPIELVIAFQAHDTVLRNRLRGRAQDQGRADDTDEAIEVRLQAHRRTETVIVQRYATRGLLAEVPAGGAAREVESRVAAVVFTSTGAV